MYPSQFDIEVDRLFSLNPFTLTGDEWREKRAEITPAFTVSRVSLWQQTICIDSQKVTYNPICFQIKAMYPIIEDVAGKMTSYLNDKLVDTPSILFEAREVQL